MTKEDLLSYTNQYVAFGTFVSFIILLFVIIYFFLLKKRNSVYDFFCEQSLFLGFIVTLFATAISLFYSEYLNVAPCGLCWFQRIFMYSQLVIFLIAYLKRDLNVFVYTFWLSLCGFVVALYQEYLQLGYSELIPCPAISNFADCAKPTFIEYGFVTFPFSALVMFSFIIVISQLINSKRK